jgi:tetratricopeptide (TPR) repeat protein
MPEGKNLSAKLFEGIPPGEEAARKLWERFRESLHNQDMVYWVEDLSLTPRFDERFARDRDASTSDYNNRLVGWERLRQLSLFEEKEGFLEMHRLLQELLRARVKPERAQAFHQWAYEHWRDRAARTGDDWRLRGLAWYHQRLCDPQAAFGDYDSLLRRAWEQGDARVLQQVAGWFRDVQLMPRPENPTQAGDLLAYGDALWYLAGLSYFSARERETSLARAIEYYQASLHYYTREEHPVEWAKVQIRLGGAYVVLPKFDEARRCYEAALQVLREDLNPEEWAEAQRKLGDYYQQRASNSNEDDLRSAIEHYRGALRVYEKDEARFRNVLGETYNQVGAAYYRLGSADQDQNLREAIDHYQKALSAFPDEEFLVNRAWIHFNLGIAYSGFRGPDRGEKLRSALQHYDRALDYFEVHEEYFPDKRDQVRQSRAEAEQQLHEIEVVAGTAETDRRATEMPTAGDSGSVAGEEPDEGDAKGKGRE